MGPARWRWSRCAPAAAQELLMRSYTVRTLNRYKRVWEQLADFARAKGQPAVYSRDLALRFEQAFGPARRRSSGGRATVAAPLGLRHQGA